jgi:hypothetical protein
MKPPLTLLCSTFKNDSYLPDTFISIHVPTFILVRDIQLQSEHVEATIKRYYEFLLVSALEKAVKMGADLNSLLITLRGLLNRGLQFFKKIFPELLEPSGVNSPQEVLRLNDRKQVPDAKLVHQSPKNFSPASTTQDRSQIAKRNKLINEPDPILSTYPVLIHKRKLHLTEIEEKKAQFSDPRAYPADLDEREGEVRKEIQRLETELAIAQQKSSKRE